MKTGHFISGILLSAALILTGCQKDDIEDLQRRVAALETWQQTVNSQITSLQGLINALESGDYVTGVSPVVENGATVGYTILFAKSAPVTILHGTDDDTVIVGVGEDTDGKYYWKVNGTWLLDNGNKIAVATDGEGVAPQLRVDGATGMWEISIDRGATWTNTGIEARGGSILAKDGVDNSRDDCLILTLADGTTSIALPKYREVGISLDPPGLFGSGQKQEISYTSTGTNAPTTIRIVDLPAEWSYSVDYAAQKITLTPPVTFHGDNFMGEATVLAGVDNQLSAMYPLKVTGDFSGPARNAQGALYYQKGVATGLVYIPNDGTSGSGRVLSLDEIESYWSTDLQFTDAKDTENGRNNMAVVYAFDDGGNTTANSFNGFPAFQWVAEKNPAGTGYAANATHIWYLPAQNELVALYNIWVRDKGTFHAWLAAGGSIGLNTSVRGGYLSSTEFTTSSAIVVHFSIGMSLDVIKYTSSSAIRAVLAF